MSTVSRSTSKGTGYSFYISQIPPCHNIYIVKKRFIRWRLISKSAFRARLSLICIDGRGRERSFLSSIGPYTVTESLFVLTGWVIRKGITWTTYFLCQIKGALDNVLKFSFWVNFIYQVKIDCLFTNTKRRIQSFLLKVRRSSIFVTHA